MRITKTVWELDKGSDVHVKGEFCLSGDKAVIYLEGTNTVVKLSEEAARKIHASLEDYFYML